MTKLSCQKLFKGSSCRLGFCYIAVLPWRDTWPISARTGIGNYLYSRLFSATQSPYETRDIHDWSMVISGCRQGNGRRGGRKPGYPHSAEALFQPGGRDSMTRCGSKRLALASLALVRHGEVAAPELLRYVCVCRPGSGMRARSLAASQSMYSRYIPYMYEYRHNSPASVPTSLPRAATSQ